MHKQYYTQYQKYLDLGLKPSLFKMNNKLLMQVMVLKQIKID